MNPSGPSALEVRDLFCQRGDVSIALGHAAFARGGFHVLRGAASSGHELLLRVLGLLESPERGEVWVEGAATRGLSDDARLRLRERRLGFVFAGPFLLPAFSVIENIAMPLFKVSAVEPAEARQRSEALLDFAGLLDVKEDACADLPPLDQHRVSFARALVNEPAAVLVEGLDTALHGAELRTFANLLRHAAAHFQIAIVATVSPDFVPDPEDAVLEIVEGAVAGRVELLPRADA